MQANATRMSLVRLTFLNQIFVLPTVEDTFREPDKDHRLYARSDTEHTLLLALPVLAADLLGMTQQYEAPDRRRLPLRASRSVLFPLRFISILFTTFILVSSAQVSAQDDVSPDDVIRVRTDLVTIPAFVIDGRGRRVDGLSQADFEVRDDGKVVTLSHFTAGTEHVALAFALDASGSIREIINQQRDAALQLFSRFGRGSRIAVLHFGERTKLTVPFTTEPISAEAAFSVNAHTGRRTAIFDAASSSIRAFGNSKGNVVERRIVILISDGLDTASTVHPNVVIREALAAGVSVYAIHLPLYTPREGRLSPRPAAKGFRDLAEKTGGRYFLVSDTKAALNPQYVPDLTPVFRAIEEDLQGQYVLGYYSGFVRPDGRYHKIDVNLVSPKARKLRVKTLRDGYSAPVEFPLKDSGGDNR